MVRNLMVVQSEPVGWPRAGAEDVPTGGRRRPDVDSRFLLSAPKPPCDCVPGRPCRECIRILNAIPAGPRL